MIVSAKFYFYGEDMKQIRRTSLGIEEDLYKKIENLAEAERRSVSQMTNVLLEEAIKEREKIEKDKEVKTDV